MQSGCWCGGRGEGDAGRGLDTSPGAAADVDVCTMAAKPVMYLSFYSATFFPDGRRRRAKPTGSAPVQQNNWGLRINQHQICHKQCLTMHYALSPLEIWKLRICQNYYLGSHFIKPELFQMQIFGCYFLCSFTFNSYLGTS